MTSKTQKWLINLKKVYMTLVFYFGLFLDESKLRCFIFFSFLEKSGKKTTLN